MSDWTARPWIEYDGTRVQTAGVDSDWTSLAVSGFSFSFGRDNLLEHAGTGNANVMLLARVQASNILFDPMGRELVIGYDTYNFGRFIESRTAFRGRVEDVEIDHFEIANGEYVFVASLSAPGRLTEVARIQIEDEAPRGMETLAQRRDYLATKLGSITAGYIGAGAAFPYDVAQRDYKGTGLLDAIQELYTTSGEAVTYNPRKDIVDGQGPWWEYRTTPVTYLVWRDGKVAISTYEDGHGTFDGGQIVMSSASVNQYQTISRRSAQGYLYFADRTGDEQWGSPYTIYEDIPGARPGMEFKADGLGFGYFGSVTETDSRYESLKVWRGIVDDARKFTPPPITQTHRNGWDNRDDLNRAIGGYEWRETGYLMGSVYSVISPEVPFCRPIGGTVRYTVNDNGVGQWETTHTLAPVSLNRALDPITLAELNPTAPESEDITYDDFHPSLSLLDLGNAEKGI